MSRLPAEVDRSGAGKTDRDGPRAFLGRTAATVLSVLAVGGALALGPGPVTAQEPGSVVEADPRIEGRSYVFQETGAEIPYALFVLPGYDPSGEWPLIVGLHGLGRPYDWLMGYDG